MVDSDRPIFVQVVAVQPQSQPVDRSPSPMCQGCVGRARECMCTRICVCARAVSAQSQVCVCVCARVCVLRVHGCMCKYVCAHAVCVCATCMCVRVCVCAPAHRRRRARSPASPRCSSLRGGFPPPGRRLENQPCWILQSRGGAPCRSRGMPSGAAHTSRHPRRCWTTPGNRHRRRVQGP